MKNPSVVVFCFCLIASCIILLSNKIHDEPALDIQLDKSSKYVGVQQPHGLGFTGNGIKVAVIDTGVDYNHPDLLGFGHDSKVVGGYDFVENDNSPMDINGHGTEVAGIIAANGIMRGIAPDAKILAYRVSDTGNAVSSELIVNAIKRAISDGADIINISLGVNRTNDRIEDAINDAVRSGVVVIVAAGNSGPDRMTIGSPGKDPHAITVGATYNNITASLVATLQVDGKRFQVLPMVGMQPTSQTITGEIVFGKYGREEDLAKIDAKDKILLVQRGSDKENELIYFSQKEKNSANAGAKALIVFNNEPGIFLGDLRNKEEGPDYKPRIPTVSISNEDGLDLANMLQNKTVGTINIFYHPDFVSFFSSRGPVSPFYIKPNLVAPGVFVNTTSINGGYNLTSGTSFAAPHVAGASALLLQKSPSLSPQEVASILTTTADPVADTFGTGFPYEVSGAGRLNVTRAFGANLIIIPDHAIFDLSPFETSSTTIFQLKTLNQEDSDIQVEFDFEHPVAEFSYSISGNLLEITASLVDQSAGQYEGRIIISDGQTKYRIPVILRISDAAIHVSDDGGKLDFSLYYQEEWSYAKISVFNSDSRLVNSVSVTPTRHEPVAIYQPGTYWIQAELKANNETKTVYSSIIVEHATQRQMFDLRALNIPGQQVLIVVLAVSGIIALGLIIRLR
ncbi:putative Subtilase family protein [Candidatus Nitrosotenuis uzonensis]|uniref:Subtilase family protein n=1 Tax=Candidatus Nitrosotenuis uzonensis TaxID=1407055 RepID=V6ARF8_9ARCH|nr:putative Subtilase family protein [Candidatus Nitrosotenuis uzonensis]